MTPPFCYRRVRLRNRYPQRDIAQYLNEFLESTSLWDILRQPKLLALKKGVGRCIRVAARPLRVRLRHCHREIIGETSSPLRPLQSARLAVAQRVVTCSGVAVKSKAQISRDQELIRVEQIATVWREWSYE